jgi:hypothetical protein
MMALQTIMQLRAGVGFGPESAAPFFGFILVSGGAVCFLRALIQGGRETGAPRRGEKQTP